MSLAEQRISIICTVSFYYLSLYYLEQRLSVRAQPDVYVYSTLFPACAAADASVPPRNGV